MPAQQARYWLLTIPHHSYTPFLPEGVQYIKGQLESGGESGYLHWQVLVSFPKKVTLAKLKSYFGTTVHAEPSRSDAANEYVWKEETRVAGTQFELGQLAFQRNSETDWAKVLESAKAGRIEEAPPDVLIRHYASLCRIRKDYSVATRRTDVRAKVFWGVTGSGKSHLAWEEAGDTCYSKNPSTKWWDGYRNEDHVIMDEFTGRIDITYLLRWLDKYPCRVEEKGGDRPLVSTKFWILSNVDPRNWYPDATEDQRAALLRRLTITHFGHAYQPE